MYRKLQQHLDMLGLNNVIKQTKKIISLSVLDTEKIIKIGSTIYLSYYKDSISIYQISIIEHSLIAWAYKHQMCHNPMVYILLSCKDLENTTNLYKKFPKDKRYARFIDGTTSK